MKKPISILMPLVLSALAALTQGCAPADRLPDAVTISGTVLAGGAPLSGVVLSGLPGNPVTGANGAYSVTVNIGFSGTATPELTGYVFEPPSRGYTNLSADRGSQNYTATLRAFTISGVVTAGSTGIAGVTMAGLPGSPVTDASGHYSALVTYGSTVHVIPTHAQYTFDPVSNTHTNVTADISGQNYAASLITTAQRRSLIAFYHATGGDGWTNRTGWKDGDLYPDGFAMPGTEGTWFGLTVDPGTQEVTRIDLPDNNLTGSLPSDLAVLTSLTYLILSGNLLTGPIPPETGSLTAVREIVLAHNGLTGSIPAEIGNATALQKIDLSYNQLTGPIPATLGNLPALYRFYATNNQLSGPLPVELCGLPNLAYVYLNTNELSGPLPAELGNMPNLVHLFLYSNELSGPIPPELGNAANLQSIVLRDNQLSGEIPAALGDLTDLLILRLGDNQLTGEIPAELGNLTKLQSLRLSHNQLSGEIPATLGNLNQLWEMLINANQLTGPIPASLMNLIALTATDLGYNALDTSDVALIAFLNSKDANWAETQTIAPGSVTAAAIESATITVSWLPVTYTADAGFYNVYMSQTTGGPYTLAGSTADKATTSLNVTGLTPGQSYYFVVRTVTNAHANNANIVESGNSNEAMAVALAACYPLTQIIGTDRVIQH